MTMNMMDVTIVQVHLDPVLCPSSPVPGRQEDAVTGDFDDDDDDDHDDDDDNDDDDNDDFDDDHADGDEEEDYDDETANIKTNQTND